MKENNHNLPEKENTTTIKGLTINKIENLEITMPEEILANMMTSLEDAMGRVATSNSYVRIYNNSKGTVSVYIADGPDAIAAVILCEMNEAGENLHDFEVYNTADFNGDIDRYECNINEGEFTVDIHILAHNIWCYGDNKFICLKKAISSGNNYEVSVPAYDYKGFPVESMKFNPESLSQKQKIYGVSELEKVIYLKEGPGTEDPTSDNGQNMLLHGKVSDRFLDTFEH